MLFVGRLPRTFSTWAGRDYLTLLRDRKELDYGMAVLT